MLKNNFLSKRISSIKPSPTLEITALAGKLRSEGKDVVGFGAGEPDFDTPDHIKEAAKKALDEGFTKYTQVGGVPSFKRAICQKFLRDNQLDFNEDQVMAGTGGKQMLYNLFMSVINPRDEVIFSAPYWVSYYDMILLAEGVPKIIQTFIEDDYKIKPEQLKNMITPQTKIFLLNSPSNPTGAVYSKEELQEIARVLEAYPDILVVTDDIYEKLIYDGYEFYNLGMVSTSILDRCVIINGLSKAFCMTGWRLGYAACKQKEIIKSMEKIQGQSTSNPTSFSQKGGETALSENMDFIDDMKISFVERRDYVLNELSKCPGVEAIVPKGAFYVFPSIEKLTLFDKFKECQNSFQEKSSSKTFARILLEEYLVAVVPGIAFGHEDAFRLSYATSMEQIKKGMDRIRECTEYLK